MKINKSLLKKWGRIVDDMSFGELQRIAERPEICYPEFLDLVKNKLSKENITATEDMENRTLEDFLKALKKNRCKYVVEEDGEKVTFTYHKKEFIADLNKECDFVVIRYVHDTLVDARNEAELTRLRKAVNAANILMGVNSVYEESAKGNLVYVVSRANLFYVTEDHNFEPVMGMAMQDCLRASFMIKQLMKKSRRKRAVADEG